MDLSVNAKPSLADDGGMDLSVNRAADRSEQESDDDEDGTSFSMSSGSESDDHDAEPSDRQLRALRHRTAAENRRCDPETRRESSCSVMDLRVGEAGRRVDTDESSVSGEDGRRVDGTQCQLSTEARFQRELQLFSEKQFPILQPAFAEGFDPGQQSADGEGKPAARREPSDAEVVDPFLNVADFLELETKVTAESSVETHATDVTFTCTACDLSFSSTLYLTQHIKHCRKLKATCFAPVLAENGSKVEPAKPASVVSNCTYRSNPGVKKKKAGYVLATCNICGKDLRNNRSLKRHMFLHRLEAGERPFACADCPASFTQNCDLTKHKRQHTGERPYACDACDARFTLVSNLSKHRKKHTGEKPHVCPDCGATFAESGSLTRHARQHSGERPYACADCGATFGQSSSLTRHKRKHTGERPYACDVCEARFTESGNLSSHRRLHTGERPYTCPRCGQGHARLSYLKNHARTCRSLLAS